MCVRRAQLAAAARLATAAGCAQALAAEYGITSIPSILVFKDGQEASRLVGLQSKAQLKAELDAQD